MLKKIPENKSHDHDFNPIENCEIWSKKLKSDNTFIIQAASYAQRAVDYIFEHQDMNAESVKVQVSDVTP